MNNSLSKLLLEYTSIIASAKEVILPDIGCLWGVAKNSLIFIKLSGGLQPGSESSWSRVLLVQLPNHTFLE